MTLTTCQCQTPNSQLEDDDYQPKNALQLNLYTVGYFISQVDAYEFPVAQKEKEKIYTSVH